MEDRPLRDLFERSRYEICDDRWTPRRDPILLHRRHPRIDRLLPYDQAWTLITAMNPAGQKHSDQYNLERQQQLREELEERHLQYFHARGYEPLGAPEWEEPSFLVLPLKLPQIRTLASKYGQAAVVFAFRGRPAELLFV